MEMVGNIGASGAREGESDPARAAFGATLRHGDENEMFKDRASPNLGYEERRGDQTIGEAALRVVHGLCPDYGAHAAIKEVDHAADCSRATREDYYEAGEDAETEKSDLPDGHAWKHLPLPRHNTSELKIAVIADLPVADLAGGHVVQPADAEVDRQAVGERVREASVRAGCFVDGAHAVPLDFARGSRSSDARYSTQ